MNCVLYIHAKIYCISKQEKKRTYIYGQEMPLQVHQSNSKSIIVSYKYNKIKTYFY